MPGIPSYSHGQTQISDCYPPRQGRVHMIDDVTQQCGASERKRALEAGCDGYVSKPIHMAGFLDVIEKALGKKEKKSTRSSRETN